MKHNLMSYRFTRAVEAEIEALINEHTPAFRKHFRPFRREMLRTAVIESIIERYTDAGIPRSIALWNMSYQKTVRMPFSTRHPDYDSALKKRGPTLADKIKNGTNNSFEAMFSTESIYELDGQHDSQWNYAESCGDLKRFAVSNG